MSETTTNSGNGKFNLNRECRCLFCGEKFPASEIEFCVKIPQMNDFYDEEFEKHIRRYKGCEDKEAPYRAWIDWKDDPTNVLIWEDDMVPFKVRGPLRNVTVNQASDFGFGLGLFGDSQEDEEEEKTDDDRIWRQSSLRVCPRCHMTLPKGFMSDQIIRVGLIGGPRSGKTTYMVVVTKYLQERLHGMGNGIGLGTITLVEECEQFMTDVYDKGVAPTAAVAGQEEDPQALPLIMRISPTDKTYKPFCLILQDIPGEYMRPEPQYREMLSSSTISESTDLIMLIDINHFIDTRQKREMNRDADKYGEYCKLDVHRLFENLENLGMCLKAKELQSIQIALTKLDFWKEEDPRIEFAVFGRNGDERHRNAISEKRLQLVNDQVKAALSQIARDDSYGDESGPDYSGLLDVMKERLNVSNPQLKTIYSAVASKTVPDHEMDFKSGTDVNYVRSLNVLEPLLNIFMIHKLLPVRYREQIAVD